MKTPRLALCVLALTALAGAPVLAGDTPPRTLEDTAASAKQDLEQSIAELAKLREGIAAEKLPMARRLAEMEERLIGLRAQYDGVRKDLDAENLDLSKLRTEIDSRSEEKKYISNLLDEYARNFESRVHISELQLHRAEIDAARQALEDPGLSPAEALHRQAALVEASADRLLEILGGKTFSGTAVGSDGDVVDVRFLLVGPVALYRREDGQGVGLAEQALGSLEPNMVPIEDQALTSQIDTLVASGSGMMPFDPSLGNARKVEITQDTIQEHVAKGGPVMIPILLLAAAALAVALYKLVQLSRVPVPSKRKIQSMLESLRAGDLPAVADKIKTMRGPTAEMLRAGVDHLGEPRDLVEEVMFEKTLDTRLRLNGLLPFVAVSAAAAPLLGLLGTVTGIINTFKLITVFGTGDAKTLSSGISEALITTEFGLIVAIPSLLLHAYLSRRARRLLHGMEKAAVSFMNRIPYGHGDPGTALRKLDREDLERPPERVRITAQPAFQTAGTPEVVDH